MTIIDVYKHGNCVGTLQCDDQGRVQFTYNEATHGHAELAISLRMPVRHAAYEDRIALPFFENLLPEGDIRRVIAFATKRAPGDVVGLLGVVGGECAGAISLWPQGLAPQEIPQYRNCTTSEVEAALGDAKDVSTLMRVLQDARMSMSGAQDKLVLYRRPPIGHLPGRSTAEYRLPVAGSPTSVLVKRDRGNFPGLVHNEVAAMSLMQAASVPVAAHTVSELASDLYETARFDRQMHDDGTVTRLHAEDGCQITGHVSQNKYGETGGPSYTDLMTQLNRYSADALADGEVLFRWAVANLAIGNRDAHAKNISVLHLPTGAIRLAPAYDVLCTLVYPALDTKLPLYFGGKRTMAELSPHAIKVAAREFKATPARLFDIAEHVVNEIENALPSVLHETEVMAGSHQVLQHMDSAIRNECTGLRGALFGPARKNV
ncbi:MAG: HipA domain-containing protein [Gemmatimonadaceae bacterium]